MRVVSRVYDVTFENVQAGERTSHLFRLANHHGALVLGTGDLSELALGWSTYGVGDHMSHYNVNASVPKTLIQFLIRWVADTDQLGPRASARVAGYRGDGSESRAGPWRSLKATSPVRRPKRSSVRTSCKISTSTTPPVWAIRPAEDRLSGLPLLA